jgi:hypothetical protein
MAAWMKTNLPDTGVATAGNYSSDNTAKYGILADWQLGYLYTYLADKPMEAEPNFCNYNVPTEFLMQTDENLAYQMLKSNGIKYVLVKQMDLNKYYYYLSQLGQTDEFKAVSGSVSGTQYVFIDAGFYQRMAVRLFDFDGQAYTPVNIFAINATSKSLDQYTSYDKAAAVLGPNVSLYSTSYSQSPVPLAALQHFQLIQSFTDTTGGVKLFQVVD